MDKTEVSNRDYAHFVKATNRSPPRHWKGPTPPPELADHPVVHVTREDAEAYARWSNKRLPTADEWEKAARGLDGRAYPWGATFHVGTCNSAESGAGGTRPVGDFPEDVSYYGIEGMGGNVSEWTSSSMEDGTGRLRSIVCGGSWRDPGLVAAVASYWRLSFDSDYPDVGFRCVRSVAAPNEETVSLPEARPALVQASSLLPGQSPASNSSEAMQRQGVPTSQRAETPAVTADWPESGTFTNSTGCPVALSLSEVSAEIVDIKYVASASGVKIPADAKYRLAVVTIRFEKPAGRGLGVAAADLTLHYRHGSGAEVAPCEGISSFSQALAEERVMRYSRQPGPGWVKQETGIQGTQAAVVYLDAVFHMIEPTISDVWICIGQPVSTTPFVTRGWTP
jgi:hypothetical protein